MLDGLGKEEMAKRDKLQWPQIVKWSVLLLAVTFAIMLLRPSLIRNTVQIVSLVTVFVILRAAYREFVRGKRDDNLSRVRELEQFPSHSREK